MRHWQPVHHARWRDFLAGISAALRGESIVRVQASIPTAPLAKIEPVAPPPVPVVVIDSVAETTPASIAETLASPSVERAVDLPVSEVSTSEADTNPEPDTLTPAPLVAEPLPEIVPQVVVEQSATEPLAEPAFAAPAPVDVLPVPAYVPPSVFFDPPPAAIRSAPLVAPATPNSVEYGIPSTARAFFSALGWAGGPRNVPLTRPVVASAAARLSGQSLIDKVVPSIRAGTEGPPVDNLKSAAYFRSLPWTGGNPLGEVITSIRVVAARADDSLDPRTATLPSNNPLLTGMLSAARTSDRMAASSPAPSPARARAYFNALPWARV